MKKKLLICIICFVAVMVLLIPSGVLAYKLSAEIEQREADLQNSHAVFVSVFGDFCDGLYEKNDEFDMQKQQYQLKVCFDVIGSSEYATDSEVSDILLKLQKISLEDNIKNVVDTETIDDIYHLRTLLTSKERLDENRDFLESINDRLESILNDMG